MYTITVLNQKGGVGKTSTCHHLSGAWAAAGKQVLVVDADPQASLTQGFFGPEKGRAIAPEATIAAVLGGALPHPGHVVRPTAVPGVAILPGGRGAEPYNVPCPYQTPRESQESLADFLAAVEGYDYCLIDCPPNLHLCSWSALVASDAVIVPVQPEDYGAQGIPDVQDSIACVQGFSSKPLTILGYLVTMFVRRRTVHQVYLENLRSLYGPAVFETLIPYAADYPEAVSYQLPVGHYRPRGAAAKAVKALALEIGERLTAAAPGAAAVACGGRV